MFSVGLSSGHFGGKGMSVMLVGTVSLFEVCHPAWSSRMTAWASDSYFGQVQIHCLDVATGQHKARALALLRTDCPENVGRGGTLIVRR
jgi:hypothetical protein